MLLPANLKKGEIMALNTLKKTLLFTTEKTKNLVEEMVEDESVTTKIKTSAILENHLLRHLLTDNPEISFWITSLYQGKNIGYILSSVFSFNAAGVNYQSCHLELLPLIEFAINEQKYFRKNKLDETIIPDLLEQIKFISDKFQSLLDNALDYQSKKNFNEAIKNLSYFTEMLNENGKNFEIVAFYRFFKWNWEIVKDWAVTFRALSVCAELQTEWRCDSESRYKLVKILRELDQSWPDEIR